MESAEEQSARKTKARWRGKNISTKRGKMMFNHKESLSSPCPKCDALDWKVGRMVDSGGGIRYPYFCGGCGTRTQLYQKKKQAISAWAMDGRTEIKTERPLPECEVCGEVGAQRHHWAPQYLFGLEADKWPMGYLCQSCHQKWHNLVTPEMCNAQRASAQRASAQRRPGPDLGKCRHTGPGTRAPTGLSFRS